MVKEKKNICLQCSEKIDPKEHSVCISTYNRFDGEKGNLPDDHTWFHFYCFVDYWNERAEKKARAQVQYLQSKALEVFNNPEIRSILSKIKGTDNIFTMLNTDLSEKPVPLEKVLEKLRNDRRKTKRKSRKTKM